ncbi:hypothetical protein JQK87_00185 [Streptomyces sp. G44]|uniref:hypothetical protein n=1 Tax=Streptomyces sp. G44 TaxID=2807632 RepID=UPI001961FBA6|nr:hypothetical protein [Streptomyces sp. G44]MBM7166870.1 hypothetical protein [Streptomyces sp. G44]
MSIKNQVACARQQLTGESLRVARLRIQECSDWGSLLPSAAETQQLLESLLLQHVGKPQAVSRYPLGIAEVVPASARVDIRFERGDLVRPALEMLPFRERGQRTIHGVPGLWATVVDSTIEVAFARRPEAGVLALSSLDSSDLGGLLSSYESGLSKERRVPLWTVDPSALPPEKFGIRRRKPQPRTVIDDHRPAVGLASALLRRIHLWDRLAGHAGIQVTVERADHGMDWHILREVHPSVPLHDDRLAAILLEPVAGPGLITDLKNHHCDGCNCFMEFTAPVGSGSGWRGILRVETVASRGPERPVSKRPRHFTALGEVGFPSHGDSVTSSQRANGHSPRPADATKGDQARGRCTQLLAPRFGRSQWDLRGIALEIGAAWALEGSAVLVVGHDVSADPEVRRLSHHTGLEWPTVDHPSIALTPPWRPERLVPGNGSLFAYTASGYRKEVNALLQEARQHFNWIIFVDCNDDYGMGPYIEESVDSHIVVVYSRRYDERLVTVEARNGIAEHREVPVSPAAAAMAWRHEHLAGVPLDRVPVAGLVLRQPLTGPDACSPDFVDQVDAELARLGTPVLTRLPERHTSGRLRLGASSPTVLDNVDDDYRVAYVEACAAIRPALLAAEPCKIPPRTDPWD